ncbi:MAG TPA: glycosyltransferase family A protein [Candidatus Angelobacter sp.]
MMNDLPLVSVVIPTYNRAYILQDAINSALEQRSANTEVIVVDDGSTDDTAALVAGYKERVIYLRQTNQGAGVARSLGVRSAQGTYIAFLDSDDVWVSDKVKTELDMFEAFTEAGAIASDADSWFENNLVETSWLSAKQGARIPAEPHFFSPDRTIWMQGSLFATSSLIIRRSCLESLGDPLFDPRLRFFEDWDLEIRLLSISRILIVPKVLASIRRYPDGTRANRATPGKDLTPEQVQDALRVRLQVLQNAIALGGWPNSIARELEEVRNGIRNQLLEVRA